MNNEKKISSKNWVLICVMGLMGQLCWAVENSTFATYALNATGKSEVVTWMVALSATFTTIATFVGGVWSDRLGKRKKITVFGFILWGIATILFGLADFIPKNQITLLSIYVVAMDCTMSFMGSVGFSGGFGPWTTDISVESNRGTIATIISSCSIVANIIIQGLQGIIYDATGSFMPIFVAVGSIVLAVGIASIFLMKEDPDLKPSKSHEKFMGQLLQQFNFKELKRQKDLFWLLTTLCVYTCGFNVYMSYSSSYIYYFWPAWSGTGISTGTGSLLLGGGMLGATVLSFLFMKPINNGKAKYVTFASIIISIIGCLWLTGAKTKVTIVLALIIACLGYMTNLASLNAWFKNLCPPEVRGGLEGVRQIFYNMIPMIVGPVVAQLIIKKLSTVQIIEGVAKEVPNNFLFLAAACIMVLAFIPWYFSNKESNKKEAK